MNPLEIQVFRERGESGSKSSLSSYPKLLKNNDISVSNHANKFVSLLNTELKRVYLHFMSKERELYVSINSHLHLRQSYDTFNLENIKRESEELWRIAESALTLSKFIHINMLAIKKILKKFDKHLGKIYEKISSKYIREKIESKNSDLLYILQFKVI